MADKLEEAAETLEKYTAIEANPKLFLRAASLRAQLCQWDQSQDLLSRGLQLFPQSPELQRASAEVLNKKLAAAAGSAGSASV
jgi:hypothetical protein